MSDNAPSLELEKVLLSDAAEILAARAKGKILHQGRDIDAAGDEVEIAVRRVLTRRLPQAYYVGHGHVVDETLKQSRQLDVVIADNSTMPILFRSENGTEYFPYEGVYAVGEVKTQFRLHNVKEFVEKIIGLRRLHRLQMTPMNLPPNIQIPFELRNGRPMPPELPYYNPMFTFMLFADGGEAFNLQSIKELYTSHPLGELPTILCFLDAGVFVNADMGISDAPAHPLVINRVPEFNRDRPGSNHRWVFSEPNDGDARSFSFGVLFYLLSTHLSKCILGRPDLLRYLERVFKPTYITWDTF